RRADQRVVTGHIQDACVQLLAANTHFIARSDFGSPLSRTKRTGIQRSVRSIAGRNGNRA
ncbi:hypothetical protein, partial [Streptococcus pneumoniae]|uniref:hypothetical protein n=1 Tax=Streptococcus pneumoniae TaxID=1313 RepID=UPI00195369C6